MPWSKPKADIDLGGGLTSHPRPSRAQIGLLSGRNCLLLYPRDTLTHNVDQNHHFTHATDAAGRSLVICFVEVCPVSPK